MITTNQTQKIVTLDENFSIDIKGIFPKIYESISNNLKKIHYKKLLRSYRNPTFIIQRNLRDDTFNMRLTVDDPMILGVKTQFQIDNKVISNHITKHELSWTKKIDDLIPHPEIKDQKFKKVSSLSASILLDNGLLKYTKRIDMGGFLAILNTLDPNQNINVDEKNIINIKTVNSIKIKKINPIEIWNDADVYTDVSYFHGIKILDPDEKTDQKVNLKYSYNNVYLKPRKISRYSHNRYVYDVFMSNEDGTPIIGDMNITNGSLKTSANGNSQMQIAFHNRLSENKTEVINGSIQKYLGYYSIEDYSYYDYDKKKTIANISRESKRGDFVPYNFRGNYIRQIKLGINCDFDALKIYESKYFENPVLDPSKGTVKLKIKNEAQDKDINMTSVNKHQLENIKNDFDNYEIYIGENE